MEISPIVRELRLAREAAGASQEKAAEMMNVSVSLVKQVETGKTPASPMYVKASEKAFPPAPGYLARLRDDGLRRTAIGEWLRDWFEIEQQADTIRWFESNLVPGLLQSEGYASALLSTETEVAARLERQQILHRDEPPDAVFIFDESALHRRIGGPETMVEQLHHLTDVPAVVQVVPADSDTYEGLDGPFVLATVGDRPYVYLPTHARGFTMENREVVSRLQLRWDILGRAALPPKLSRELIMKVAEQWKSSS